MYRSFVKAFEALHHTLEAIGLLAMHSISDGSSHTISDQPGINKALSLSVEVENGDILSIRSSHLIAVPTFSFIDPALEGAKLEAVLARLSVIAGPGNETEWIDPRSPSLC